MTLAGFRPVAPLCVAGLLFFATGSSAPAEEAGHGHSAAPAKIGGPFSLTDQTGRPKSDGDFRGRYMLVFFGFAHCPDVCPETMAQIDRLMVLLGDDAGGIQPVLISVDPLRDNPRTMSKFLDNFESDIVGLTGSRDDLEEVASAYLVHVEAPEHVRGVHRQHQQSGLINHSAVKYLMGPDGQYVRHFGRKTGAEEMAREIAPLLASLPASGGGANEAPADPEG